MKRIIYLFILFLAMNNILPSIAQSYDSMWKKVAEFDKKDLPQSAIDEATRIYNKAKKEQQLPQLMKAYLTMMQYRSRISSDSLKVDVKALTEWAERSEELQEQAILFSILGEVTFSSDKKQAYSYMVRSLKEREALLQIPANTYIPLVEEGEVSKRYGADSLYDLLARRALEWLQKNKWSLGRLGEQSYSVPDSITSFQQFVDATLVPASEYDGSVCALQIYQSLLQAYNSDQKRSIWLLTAIDAWQYLKENVNALTDNTTYTKELIKWSEQYKGESASAYVCAELAANYIAQQKMVDALQWVRIGMQSYPKSEALNRLKNLEQQIVEPSFSILFPSIYPGIQHQATVSYKNLTQVSLELLFVL